MTTATKPSTLDEFLQLPETQPAAEFIHGQQSQKPMPQGEHSRLQSKLCSQINQVAEPSQLAYAFPELRCVFGGQAIVPDIAVFRWPRIPRTLSGKIANRFELAPDWAIEILSPDQQHSQVLAKLLHCSEHGTDLGWLLLPEEEAILAVLPEQRVQLFRGNELLPIPLDLPLELTVQQVFGWLTL
jgi:Uma2 family endonuclease